MSFTAKANITIALVTCTQLNFVANLSNQKYWMNSSAESLVGLIHFLFIVTAWSYILLGLEILFY